MDVLDKADEWKTSRDQDDHAPLERRQILKVKVISKGIKSPPTISTFSCLSLDTDTILMERLRSHYKRVYARGWLSRLLSFVLMRNLMLGFATYPVSVSAIFLSLDFMISSNLTKFSQTSTTDLEARLIRYPVRILETEIDETLTAAFHNPKAWLHGRDLTFSLLEHDNSPNLPPWKGKALYMTELFDRGKARLLVLLTMPAIVVCGLVIGFVCHSLAVGLAVSGGLSAWISCAQFLLLKQYT